ncbi:hypothetical protein FA15DRAFT_697889 [Coprinopsis marcescibilis]|uniref:DUF6699 domain-containing protein n=1 Tax=Coprinopsis marcescibilis TaxID=230819 RepID=A0A5C3KGN1_COPMA|nr:hypothetical protein FA15DRAFT_697889 [Coprinopsis marcescibilis]
MSYHAPSAWSVNSDKELASKYQYTAGLASPAQTVTPASTWGTLPSDTASTWSVPRPFAEGYAGSPIATSPYSQQKGFAPLSHPSLTLGMAQSLGFDVSKDAPPRLPFDPRESAFNPPLTSIILQFEGLSPGWQYKVMHPTSITVSQIFEAVQRHCSSAVRRDQELEIPNTLRPAITTQYQHRLHRNPTHQGSPLLMLDVLGSRTLFVGLTPKSHDLTVWVIHFGQSPFGR